MIAEGADMLDVGAMSTAPYLQTQISEVEEIRRLTWAIGLLRTAISVPVSADTKRSRVALAALGAGATVINDVSGFRCDAAMARAAADHAQGAILMASESAPGAKDPIGTVRDCLNQSLALSDAAGVGRNRIVLDPGIGFFRKGAVSWVEWDCQVLRRLGELRTLGRPILVGVSRKSFIGKLLGKPDPDDRLPGSLAATAIAILNGAHMVRTHDVGATRDAIRLAEALRPG
jgi:dihydropteroate synthase